MSRFIISIKGIIQIIIGFCILLNMQVYGQELDTAALNLEFQKSKLYIHNNQIDSAITSLSRLSDTAQKEKYWELMTASKIQLARIYEEKEDFDNTLKNYIELIRILDKNEAFDQLALTYYSLGEDYEKYNLYNKAIRFFSLAGSYFKTSGNVDKLVESLSRQSDLYLIIENFEMADSALNSAVQILKKSDSGKDIIPFLQRQVEIYNNLGESDQMLRTNLEILEIYKRQKDHKSVIKIQNDIGFIHAANGEYNMAIFLFLESLEASSQFELPDSVRINILTNIGIAYSALDQNSISVDTLSKVEAYYLEKQQPDKLARIQNLIAEVYLKQVNISKALEYSMKSVYNAESSGDISILMDCYKTLSDIYQESDDFKNGLMYFGLYSDLKDSISRRNIARNIEINRLEQNATNRERSMILMVMDEEIEELALENLRIESERYLKEIELYKTEKALEKEAQKRKLLALIFIFLAFFLILIVFGYFAKKKDNKILKQQKESILNINHELKSKNEAVESALEKLRVTQSKLVESEKMASLGQLTAGIAHEINNPINFISSNLSPLKLNIKEIMEILNEYRKLNDPESKPSSLKKARQLEEKYDIEYLIKELNTILDGISDGAERTKEIVLGLRNFSRLDKHKLMEVKLSELIDSSLVLLRNQYKDRIEITKSYDPDLVYVECYPGQLSQVLMNIFSNAIQAIGGQGTISVKTELFKKEAVIIISDTGKGIPQDKLDNIFDPFYTTKEVGEGTGLGLSISYGIIQEHNGRIDVESVLGEGATFKISLPVRQEE